MTKAEKKRLSTVIRATEYLFLENIALKLVLEHRAVPNWQKLLERLLSDKEILAGVRLKFRDLYDLLEGSEDPSGALEALLSELPAPKKRNSGRSQWCHVPVVQGFSPRTPRISAVNNYCAHDAVPADL